MCISLSVFQRDRTNRRLSVCLSIYFKELAHVIREAVQSETGRADWQGGTQERADVATWASQQSGDGVSSSLGGNLSFSLLRPSTDWMGPTHITDSNLFYSESTELNINLIWRKKKKDLHSNIQADVWPNKGALWSSSRATKGTITGYEWSTKYSNLGRPYGTHSGYRMGGPLPEWDGPILVCPLERKGMSGPLKPTNKGLSIGEQNPQHENQWSKWATNMLGHRALPLAPALDNVLSQWLFCLPPSPPNTPQHLLNSLLPLVSCFIFLPGF